MTTLVYLAGSIEDEHMSLYMQQLRDAQCTITWDWSVCKGGCMETNATRDLDGVARCELFVAVMDLSEYPYRGTFTELGSALALKKPVLIVTGIEKTKAWSNCFFWHPGAHHCATFETVLRVVRARQLVKLGQRPKLMILGAGRSGKDTLAGWLAQKGGYTFQSSSEAVNRLAVYPTLKERYGYASEQACFEDRANHRIEWYQLICDYNGEDKARLAREIIATSDMYVGMRDPHELEASRSLLSIVIWVNASKRTTRADESMKITIEQADLVIDNNDTLEKFEQRAERLLALLQ